jgi:hypothetical protein
LAKVRDINTTGTNSEINYNKNGINSEINYKNGTNPTPLSTCWYYFCNLFDWELVP